jgi:hypothetical protein
MWGSRDPVKKPPPRLVVKEQLVYSETNYNVFLATDPQTGSIAAEFPLGDLVAALQMPLDQFKWPVYVRERMPPVGELGVMEICDRCQLETRVPCQLFVRPQPRSWVTDEAYPDAVRSLMRKPFQLEGAADGCGVFQGLVQMTETAQERRFYQLYFERAVREAFFLGAHQLLSNAIAHPPVGSGPVGGEAWNGGVGLNLTRLLKYPAFLPQVHLNFIRAADLPEDHPDRHFYDSNVGRVDFVFVAKGERHIIEIDGPTHHATEKGYTRNLRVERTLRHQGWHVHRFSNLEVKEAKDFQDFAWELGLLPDLLRGAVAYE